MYKRATFFLFIVNLINWDNVTNSVSQFFEKISKLSGLSPVLSAIGIDFDMGSTPKPIALLRKSSPGYPWLFNLRALSAPNFP